MHKLAKGLKKIKKGKKSKKGEEDEDFNPEELERYRRERAEAQQRTTETGESSASPSSATAAGAEAASSTGTATAATNSDEWKKFEALTAGIDSVLKKTQGDLDRIKSTSFFQRKPPLEEEQAEAETKVVEESAKKWVGFDAEGNPIAAEEPEEAGAKKEARPANEEGIFEVPDEDDDNHEEYEDEDIFDTTYVEVLENIDVQLAYIPDSPTQEEAGDDPFDTTVVDKVLKTVDKKGKKLVSLGNAVEVLSGRIDHVSTCKLTARPRKAQNQDLLLEDFDEAQVPSDEKVVAEPVEVEKTLLDEDTDLPDIPDVDLTQLPAVLPKPAPATEETRPEPALDISEFEVFQEKNILSDIPDLDDSEFDLEKPSEERILQESEDPFAAKEPEAVPDFQTEIVEAVFEAATFADEEDPFDTAFAENILPGKTELKFLEKELEELPESEVSISLTDPAGLDRDYETGLLKQERKDKDLLSGSATDLTQLPDDPIALTEELTYVDPFNTSSVEDLQPGKTELKFLERELLEQERKAGADSLEDDDFDPRAEEEEEVKKAPPPRPPSLPKFAREEPTNEEPRDERKQSRPEVLGFAASKAVAFDLPTPSQRPDLLTTSAEEKSIPSKPLTPYYPQKSLEESLPAGEAEEEPVVDPFDTSFVTKVSVGKTELKLIESELLDSQVPVAERPLNLPIVPEPKVVPKTEVVPERTKVPKLASTKRQESILDADVEVDAKPLTPKIETKSIPESEEFVSADPFDTSIAVNILPGKAELKILETELSQIPNQQPKLFELPAVDPDFDPRAEEPKPEPVTDFLSLEEQDPGAKVLTPLQEKEPAFEDDIDPFDTSFATLGPGRTELKLLESELMER